MTPLADFDVSPGRHRPAGDGALPRGRGTAPLLLVAAALAGGGIALLNGRRLDDDLVLAEPPQARPRRRG